MSGCVFPNAKQCEATSKRTGQQCRAPALSGTDRCRFHRPWKKTKKQRKADERAAECALWAEEQRAEREAALRLMEIVRREEEAAAAAPPIVQKPSTTERPSAPEPKAALAPMPAPSIPEAHPAPAGVDQEVFPQTGGNPIGQCPPSPAAIASDEDYNPFA